MKKAEVVYSDARGLLQCLLTLMEYEADGIEGEIDEEGMGEDVKRFFRDALMMLKHIKDEADDNDLWGEESDWKCSVEDHGAPFMVMMG